MSNNAMTRDEYLFWRLVDADGEKNGGNKGLLYQMELEEISPLYQAYFKVTGTGVKVCIYVYIDDTNSPYYKSLREQGFDNYETAAEKVFFWNTFNFDIFMEWIDLHGKYKFSIPEDIQKKREKSKGDKPESE